MEAERCLKSRNNLISLSETNMAFTSKYLKKITEVKLFLIFWKQEGITEWKCDTVLAGQISHMSAYAKHRALVNGTTKPFTTLCSSTTHYVRILHVSTSLTRLNDGYLSFWASNILCNYVTLVTKVLEEITYSHICIYYLLAIRMNTNYKLTWWLYKVRYDTMSY
jgi:hypothetical protein